MLRLPVYVIFRDGKVVSDDSHADMLRYDRGFCNPATKWEVIFPVFMDTKWGKSPTQFTEARWRSFGLTVDVLHGAAAENFGDWITYVQQLDELVPVTLDQWLQAHPGLKIVGTRV